MQSQSSQESFTSTSPVDFYQITDDLLGVLDARSRDIVTRRFGLKTGEVETLESIGREYGITRERVRQIESQAKKALALRVDVIEPVAGLFEDLFTQYGGILEDAHVVRLVHEAVPQKPFSSMVTFYLELLPVYRHVSRDADFLPHWQHSDLTHEYSVEIARAARELLKEKKHPIAEEALIASVREAVGGEVLQIPVAHVLAALIASKHIDKTPFKEWGLVKWPETRPSGVGDKAYAVLRRHSKPEHFTEITRLINEAHFDHKTANPQTVHNELIKDSRFVLVGRGLYGLAEWGYIPGTVADVLEAILAEAAEPLSREELIKRVLEQRQVKKNTILLGLQNHDRFIKTDENRYALRAE